MTDIRQEDRELLAAEYEADGGTMGNLIASRIRAGTDPSDDLPVRAIAKQRAISEAWAKQDGERAMQFDRLREECDKLRQERDEANSLLRQASDGSRSVKGRLAELLGCHKTSDAILSAAANLLSLLKEAGEIHARYQAKLQARENGRTAAYRVVNELAALAERITALDTAGAGAAETPPQNER